MNKERVAASRLKKKNELGGDAYRALEALKRKQRRDRFKIKNELKDQIDSNRKELKVLSKNLANEASKRAKIVNVPAVRAIIEEEAIPIVASLDADDTCESLFKKILSAKKEIAESKNKTIKESSIKSQFVKVQNIYKKMNNKPIDCSNFNWLRDTDKVLKFIQDNPVWKTADSKSGQVQAISSILSVVDGFQKEYKIYSKYSTIKRAAIDKIKSKNLLTDRERNLLPWATIKTAWDSKNSSLSERDRALVGIYVLLPPRRVEVIASLILSNSAKLDLSQNYLIIKNKIPIEFVYNNYKTSKKYGTQKISINKALAVILQAHIKKSKIKLGQFLFGTNKNTQYANFSNQITDSFANLVGTHLTANLLRHSYISWFLSTGVKSIEEQDQLARKMGTSKNMLQQYLRVDIATQI
jgi:hypothetical protein